MQQSQQPAAAPSHRAVEAALRWYAEEVHLAERPPITAEAASDLLAVLQGEKKPAPGQLETWVSFAHTMFLVGRRAPELPTCNLGDVLSALAALEVSPNERWPWRWDTTLDAEAFSKLRFSEASAGIVKTERENREGWRAHAAQNRAFIVDAASGCARQELAVVLGAGQAFDLPLVELAQSFERLVLVDIDGPALEATIASTVKDPGLRARIEPRVLDLSGINGQLVRAVEGALAGAGNAREASEELARLCRSYHLPTRPRLLAGSERADLLVSGLVLTQVSWPQRVFALRLFEQRFGKLSGAAERDWVVPWWELELRIQQDHLTSLVGCAERLVVCSDVISRPTLRDPSGVERETGRKIFALGVAELLERVPTHLRALQHKAWSWHRYRAGTRPGSIMDVEGLLLVEA